MSGDERAEGRGVLLHYFRRRKRRRRHRRLLTNKVAGPEGRKGGRETEARFLSGFLTNPLFPSIHHFHAAADKRTDRARMTIFSPPLPSLLIRRRDATCSERKGASGIPFCPPSWKQLENGCGMLGRRQRGQEKVPAVERASERQDQN